MLETSLRVLDKLVEQGYKAYIVGGFVRDYILGIDSSDIDITTNATPKQVKEIFEDACLPVEDYGSVDIMYKGVRFEITTFRRESLYVDNRKPIEIKYIDDLYEDLTRRDFTINTICMNKDGEIIDFLKGKADIEDRIIRTVGDADEKFSQDALRILRAVRFATNLDFSLSADVKEAIIKNRQHIKNLSYHRKKQELDRIFTSSNSMKGIAMLLDLGLDKVLELKNLDKVKENDSLIGVWSLLDVEERYPFTKNEKSLISNIQKVYELNELDQMVLYKYGLYVCSVVATMKTGSKKEVTEIYNNLPIQDRSDLNITTEDIIECLKKEPGPFLTEIYEKVEEEVISSRIQNDKDQILRFIEEQYL